jgi:hypothetical protein
MTGMAHITTAAAAAAADVDIISDAVVTATMHV